MATSNVSKLFDHAAHNGSNYLNGHFSEYRTKSVQEFHFELSQGIRRQIFFCHFREKYRNTYKIKCHDKGLKTVDSSTSLSFIKL